MDRLSWTGESGMTLSTFLRRLGNNRITRKTKAITLWPMRSIVRSIAAKPGSRAVLNRYYDHFDAKTKARFQSHYSRVFRQEDIPMSPGAWHVNFAGRTLRVPLRSEWAWLDWDLAVSIVGHDIEVIQTYEALVNSFERPDFFFDVGANYGTHSILFLSAGIPVIAFEPNPNCHPYFEAACGLNGFSGRWEQVAAGSAPGEIELVFPEKETWLGSVSSDITPGLDEWGDVTRLSVPVRSLDSYMKDIPFGKVLIKIDVEGYEIEVLKGAAQMLRDYKPAIIFESNDAKLRPELFSLFEEFSYGIHPLPYRPSARSRAFSHGAFLASTAINFIALPG